MDATRTLVILLVLSVTGSLAQQDCLTFTLVPGNFVSRGATATSDTTRTACEQTCRSNTACLSYQLDTNPGHQFCWIQTQTNALVQSNLYFDVNINEYVKNTTCACRVTYTNTTNFATNGATLNSGLTSEQDCRNFCTAQDSCLSYQADTTQGTFRCWIQTNSNQIVYLRQGVVEYTKVKDCSTVQPCTYVFEEQPANLATIGATGYPQFSSEAACRAECLAQSTCYSYQLDLNAGATLCWIQFSQKDVYVRQNVREFKKVCSTSQATTTVATTSGACPPTFKAPSSNLVSIGATSRADLTTDDACRAACASSSACVSYQIDRSTGSTSRCWVQNNAASLLSVNLVSRPGVDEYVKDTTSCLTTATTQTISACPPSFNAPVSSNVSSGATLRADVTTDAGCEAACRASAACVSYQIEVVDFRKNCWIQENAANLLPVNLIIRPAVIEYVKNTTYCLYSGPSTTGSPCTIVFVQQTPGGATYGAISNTTFPTADACRAACLRDTACLSYQLNADPNQVLCWLQYDRSALTGTRYSQPAVTEFIKTCSSATTSAATTAVAVATTTTTAAPSSCVAQYRANPANQGSLGAQSVTVGSFADCQAACTADSTCVSFQVDSTLVASCWLQRSASALQVFYSRPNVVEYIKYCLGSSTTSITTAAPGCVNTFQAQNANQVTLGAQSQQLLNEAQCQSSCLADPTCLSYQINSNANSILCWLQKNPQNTQLYFQQGVQEYKKVCIQQTYSAPSCVVTYNPPTVDVASSGATPVPAAATDDQCKQACTIDAYCLSYQIDSNAGGTRCWIQRSPIVNVYSRPNVVEYVKSSNCSQANATTASSSSTAGTTTPTTTTATTTTAATSTLTSTVVTSATTLAPVSCSVIYQVPNPGYLSLLATQQSGTSAAGCEGNCTSNPMCLSYQVVDSVCWQQMDRTSLNNLYFTDMTYFEYVKICARNCTLGITFYEDASGLISQGAESRPLLNEVQCRDACQLDDLCKSYQIERSSGTPTCWLQRSASPFVEANTYPKYPQIAEYKKFCGTWTGPTSSPPSTTTTTQTTTTTATTTTTRSSSPSPRTTPTRMTTTTTTSRSSPSIYDTSPTSTPSVARPNTTTTTSSPTTTTTTITTTTGCQPVYSWFISPDQNMAGGSLNRATSLKGCQDACTALDSCVGIDLDQNSSPPACYLITSSVALTPAPGVTHYSLVRTYQQGCSTSTTTTPPISTTCSTVVKMYGVNSDAGAQVASQVSEETCLAFCNSDPLCTSADYAVNKSACYVHRGNSSGYDEQANNCCIRFSKCTGTNQPPSCRVQFSSYVNFGVEVQKSYNQFSGSLDDCRARCLSTNCSSFSYMSYTSSCYLFRGEVTSIGQQPGSTLYIRNFCLNPAQLPSSTTSTTLPTPSPGECLMDLALLLDSSGSINENTDINNWELQKNFAQKVASTSIRYGYYFDHLAVVTFSDTASVAFDFNKYYANTNDLMAAIGSLPFAGSQTNLPAAMSEGRRLFLDPLKGSRPAAIRAMVMITDGVVSSPWVSNFQPEVALLNATDIKRFAVGVGNLVNMNQLSQFASPGGLAWVSSFSNIGDALKNLSLFINQFPCNNVLRSTPLSSQRQPSSSSSTTTTTTTTTTSSPSVTTSTSTTTTTINVPVPGIGVDCTFGVSLTNNPSGPLNPLLANFVHANRLNGLFLSNDSCRMSLNYSNSLVEICAGIPGNTMVQLQTLGAYPTPIGMDWLSTTNNDLETNCRTAVVGFSRGVAINLALASGSLYSLQKQSGWNSFSITNTISNPNWIFSGYSSEAYTDYSILRFPNPNVNPTDGIYNTADNTYECRTSGYYFFSFSAGVPADKQAMMYIEGLEGKYYMAQRKSLVNGLTTISRSLLIPCSGKVRLILQVGSIVAGANTNLISFTAFPFNTRPSTVAWSAFRTTNSDATDPLSFDEWPISEGIRRSDMSAVGILTGGYYYVYVSVGTVEAGASSVTLRVNGNVVYTLDRRSNTFAATDILGRGVVIYLKPNDLLKVVVENGFSIVSSVIGYHTSFFGMYIGA